VARHGIGRVAAPFEDERLDTTRSAEIALLGRSISD
jgi:hypothetical protein